jgi:hypothetical protein
MRADALLRLYPRAWRARYGDELLDLLGDQSLRPFQILDLVSGAIDAWLSADVRRASAAAAGSSRSNGGAMTMKSLIECERANPRVTTRDSLIGAGVMLAATAVFMFGGFAIRDAGWVETGNALTTLGSSAALTLSMPFWILKGQPWKAQAALVAGPLAILTLIAYANA